MSSIDTPSIEQLRQEHAQLTQALHRYKDRFQQLHAHVNTQQLSHIMSDPTTSQQWLLTLADYIASNDFIHHLAHDPLLESTDASTSTSTFITIPASSSSSSSSTSSASSTSVSSASEEVQVISPSSTFASISSNHTFVQDSIQHKQEIGLVDVNDIDWWYVIPQHTKQIQVDDKGCMIGEQHTSTLVTATTSSDDDTFTPIDQEEDRLSDSSYVIVHDHDVMEAMGEFIAHMIKRHPKLKAMDHMQMQQLLAGTIKEIAVKPTVSSSIWQMGKSCYDAYNYASFAYMGLQICRDPQVALFVSKVIFSVFRYLWILVL